MPRQRRLPGETCALCGQELPKPKTVEQDRNILAEMWRSGGVLPLDDAVLAEACGRPEEWATVRDAVLACFEASDGHIYYPDRPLITIGRRSLPTWLRRLVLARDGSCRLCGSTEQPQVDHIRRVREGGEDTIDNLRQLCGPCNRARG